MANSIKTFVRSNLFRSTIKVVAVAYAREILAEIKDRLDIVEVARGYVRLEKQGRNFVGLCPFHQEKTPSFTVSPEKQIFYCFGCGAGGDIFTFVSKIDNLDFPETVRRLAEMAGITLPEETNFSEGESRSRRERLYQLYALAARFYSLMLEGPEGKGARKYLQERGVSGEIAKRFQLGYAPQSPRALLKYLEGEGFPLEEIIAAGLAGEREGGIFDLFRGRLMFPICDYRGRVIGFGGRVLDGSLPKYINSPETLLFHKGYHLYGLHLAAQAIRQRDWAIIVEGYMDVIAAHRAGIENVVATMGTSFTPQQAKELRRFTAEAVIAYDADAAGQTATLRGLSILHQAGVKVKVLVLPAGMDPDDFIKKEGANAFEDLAAEASPLIAYRLERAISTYGLSTEHNLARIVAEVVPDIARLDNAVERDGYIRLVSRRIARPEQSIYEEVQKYIRKEDKKEDKIKYTRFIDKRDSVSRVDNQEIFLLTAYINDPFLAQVIEASLGADFWEQPGCRCIRDEIEILRSHEPGLAGETLLKLLETEIKDAQASALLARLKIQNSLALLLTPAAIQDTIARLRIRSLYRLIKRKEQELARVEFSGDSAQINKLQAEIFRLQQELKLAGAGKEEVKIERGAAEKAADY